MSNSDEVIKRIKSSVNAGVKARAISAKSGITYYRIASVINTESYRYSTTFTDSEVKTINKAINDIMNAMK